jgi:hypothetical protein
VNGPHRHAATEEHQRAITTINDMFDRLDELVAARDRLTGVAPLGPHDDPIRDAESLLHHAELLNQALSDLRLAALAASAHRRRSDLAADVGTKVTSLFPRTGRDPSSTSPMDDESDPAAATTPAHADRDALSASAEPAAG